MFAAIAAVGAVATRFRQSVIPFYIVVGMVLSEFVIGRVELPVIGEFLVSESEFITLGAKLGINFGAGLVIGWLVFEAFLPALLIAGIVYISSSAVITKSLIDMEWIANDESEPLLGTLVYEDLFITVYLAVVVTTPTKLVSGFFGGRAFGLDTRRSTRVALGMTTRGEFSLIIETIAITGAEAGAFPPELAATINAFAVGYVLVMAILGTTLMQYSEPFERFAVARIDGTDSAETPD